MRKVSLEMLTPKMILGKPICMGTRILINKGTKDLDRFIDRLQGLGISHLYIEDDACEDIFIDDLISDRTRLHCKKTLETSFNRLRDNFSIDLRQITDVVDSLMEEILDHPNILVSLNEIGGIGDNTLDHSVNTTLFSICLAAQLGYDKATMLDLAQGTLLHDIGKTALNSNILFKPGKLSDEEFQHVKQHAQLGYELLGKDRQISEVARRIALNHHERVDGSGYPNGLTGDQLSDFVKITAIVDVYEALTVNRCYHRAVSPQRAIEILTEESVGKLDFNLTRVFMQNIAVYPNGTMVLLSTGQLGIIKEQNQSMPLRPVVRIVTLEKGKCTPKDDIDLMHKLNITILASDVSITPT